MSTAAYDEAALPVSMICILPPLTAIRNSARSRAWMRLMAPPCWRCLTTQQLRSHQYGRLASVLLGLDEQVEGRPRPAMRGALGQVKDRPLARRLDRPPPANGFNLDAPQLDQLSPAAAAALRRQVADSPDRKTARALPTLRGVEPENCAVAPGLRI